MEKVTGYVTGVNGNLVSARFSGSVRKNEVGFVKIGNDRLKGEVIRISGDAVSMQIYEMTNGIQVGDEVELTGELLSVELGPGLLRYLRLLVAAEQLLVLGEHPVEGGEINLSLLLEPASWFPESDEPEERVSLVSSLHLLELMKNAILTVENRALKAVIAN